jgi:hypothetical protein
MTATATYFFLQGFDGRLGGTSNFENCGLVIISS